MTPSTTRGVADAPRAVCVSYVQARPSSPTLPVPIDARGLNRCSPYVRPCESQFPGSESAARMRAVSTSPGGAASVAQATMTIDRATTAGRWRLLIDGDPRSRGAIRLPLG